MVTFRICHLSFQYRDRSSWVSKFVSRLAGSGRRFFQCSTSRQLKRAYRLWHVPDTQITDVGTVV